MSDKASEEVTQPRAPRHDTVKRPRAAEPHKDDGGGDVDRRRQRRERGGDRREVSQGANSSGGGGGTGAPSPSSGLRHPFRANFNDHFETSLAALRDVAPALSELRALTRPSTPELFTLYDPYYCAGTVAQRWAALGFPRVLHENRDFYADVAAGTVPGPYDVLVTNPPFSDDHLQRMMDFLVGCGRPWAFLAPDYVASKEWYVQLVRRHYTPAPPTGRGDISAVPRHRQKQQQQQQSRFEPPPFLLPPFLAEEETKREETKETTEGTAADTPGGAAGGSQAAAVAKVGVEPFYIVPRAVYDFEHPVGAGHAHSHFRSMWYVYAGRHTGDVLRAARVAYAARVNSATTKTATTTGAAAAAGPVQAIHGLEALKESRRAAASAASAKREGRDGHGGVSSGAGKAKNGNSNAHFNKGGAGRSKKWK